MHKGEEVISLALAFVVVLTFVAIQRQWNPANLKDVASSAEDFILASTGIGGQVPGLVGYETLKSYRLGSYRAALYRQTPAPLVFASGRFIIYNNDNQWVYKIETLEGSKESWTTLYDFAGHHGLPAPGSRNRPEYTKSLAGNGVPDIVIGQYSGGDHCCSVATVIELGKQAVTVLGRIDGLNGLPFEGLEIRDIHKDQSWECVAHRPYITACGPLTDAADVPAIYACVNGQFIDQTDQYADYLNSVQRQHLAKWRQEKTPSLGLLQTLVVDFAKLGQKDEGKRFFAMNLSLFLPNLRQGNYDPNACLDDVENLVDRLPSVQPAAPPPPTSRAERRSASGRARARDLVSHHDERSSRRGYQFTSQHRLVPVLENLLDAAQELLGHGPIDDPVIVREGKVGHPSDGDGVVTHDRPFLDGAYAKDGHLRLVDDRQAEETPKASGIRDGESPSLHIIDAQPFGPCPISQILDCARDPKEVLLIGALDDRHNKPGFERHRDANVDVPFVNNVGALN